jgi:hypothetical protein
VRILDRLQQNIYKKPKAGERRVRVQDEIYNYLKNDKEQYLKSQIVKPAAKQVIVKGKPKAQIKKTVTTKRKTTL